MQLLNKFFIALILIFVAGLPTLTSARYLEPDPIGQLKNNIGMFPSDGKLNHLYGYTDQNPVNGTDRLGLFTTLSLCARNPVACQAAGIGGVGGGAVGAGVNAASQYLECGEVDWGEVGQAGLEGMFFGATLAVVEFRIAGAILGRMAASRGLVAGVAGGSIRNVNRVGGQLNCANCSIATDATLAGRPASALDGVPTYPHVLESFFGSRFGSPTSISRIRARMEGAGDGSRGVVFGYRGENTTGHYFNVINQGGTIRFLDGQTGGEASLSGFKSFSLLRTN